MAFFRSHRVAFFPKGCQVARSFFQDTGLLQGSRRCRVRIHVGRLLFDVSDRSLPDFGHGSLLTQLTNIANLRPEQLLQPETRSVALTRTLAATQAMTATGAVTKAGTAAMTKTVAEALAVTVARAGALALTWAVTKTGAVA